MQLINTLTVLALVVMSFALIVAVTVQTIETTTQKLGCDEIIKTGNHDGDA